MEAVTVFIFCIEYALHIWTANYLYPGMSKSRATIRFLVSFDGIVDLLTIIPAFSVRVCHFPYAARGKSFPPVPSECQI